MSTIATKVGETTVFNGDCLDVMATLAALGTRVDSIVTDPPYHLSTVKRYGSTNMTQPADKDLSKVNAGQYKRLAKGFMGKEWDGGDIAFQVETWRRCWSLLKPGGYLLAFSGSRTYHRMACAIEDAGFEIRDQLMWLYGTGFPKSHDVSKAIDKAAGAEREVVGTYQSPEGTSGKSNHQPRIGTSTRIGGLPELTAPATGAARQWDGWGTALKPAHEPIVMARKPLDGTVAANVLQHGVGAINIDACRVGTDSIVTTGRSDEKHVKSNSLGASWSGVVDATPRVGRFPANVMHDGSAEVLEAFAAYATPRKKARVLIEHDDGRTEWKVADEVEKLVEKMAPSDGLQNTAARFFYSAKASAKDRAGSKHPTVKPVSLIEYYATMVTPPGGLVLDPFAGSGTLGTAWPHSILIEREPEYYADILNRLSGNPAPPRPAGRKIYGVFADEKQPRE